MILRLVRAECGSDAIRLCKIRRAREHSDRAIHFVHALRNTCASHRGNWPKYRGIDRLFSDHGNGFSVAGTGLMFIQAVDFVDVPIMAAYLIFVALLFGLNLIVDILYFVVDPRIQLEKLNCHLRIFKNLVGGAC